MLVSLDPLKATINYLWWESKTSNAPAQKAQYNLSDVEWATLTASHRYRTWDINYDSLIEAYLHDAIGLPKLKWLV